MTFIFALVFAAALAYVGAFYMPARALRVTCGGAAFAFAFSALGAFLAWT